MSPSVTFHISQDLCILITPINNIDVTQCITPKGSWATLKHKGHLHKPCVTPVCPLSPGEGGSPSGRRLRALHSRVHGSGQEHRGPSPATERCQRASMTKSNSNRI